MFLFAFEMLRFISARHERVELPQRLRVGVAQVLDARRGVEARLVGHVGRAPVVDVPAGPLEGIRPEVTEGVVVMADLSAVFLF